MREAKMMSDFVWKFKGEQFQKAPEISKCRNVAVFSDSTATESF
jgi:hypothetical protein